MRFSDSPLRRGRFQRVIAGFILGASGMLLILLTWHAAGVGLEPSVNLIHAPAGCLVPDVTMDTRGVLHIVYGLEHHAYYVQSADNGSTFTPPVKVNSSGTVETKMGERGPKLAVGSDGGVHVVWVDEWAPGVKTLVRYSRCLDGGKSFEALKTLSAMPESSGGCFAGLAGGTDGRQGHRDSQMGTVRQERQLHR